MRAKEFLNEAKRGGPGHAWSGSTGDLGQSFQAKKRRYIDPAGYVEMNRRQFQNWLKINKLKKSHYHVLFDLKGKPQDTVIFHPPGKPNDIWAYFKPAGSATSSAPVRMVKKDKLSNQ